MGSQALCKVKVHYAKGPQHISMEIKKTTGSSSAHQGNLIILEANNKFMLLATTLNFVVVPPHLVGLNAIPIRPLGLCKSFFTFFIHS